MTRIHTVILLLVVFNSRAQIDTLYAVDRNTIAQTLRETTDQYMVFIQLNSMPKQTMTSLWSRSVRFKTIGGRDVVEIEQKWFASDSASYRYIYSLVDKQTFLPLYHKVRSQRTGIEAFDFYADKIVGSDTVPNNARRGFTMNLKSPALNWELDLETLGLLPLAKGKSYWISFYHPGGREGQKLYEYKVIGDEVLTIGNNTKVACWKLRISYNEKSWATFFISKKTKEVIKMEESFGAGMRYKVKLPLAIPVH
jgi:hypothetical protein